MDILAAQEDIIPFAQELQRATVIERPNRFVVLARGEGGERLRCHCPVTGSIGGFSLDGLPCLLSAAAPGAKRTTTHTVEAIAPRPGEWVGINQNMANRYVEQFLLAQRLPMGELGVVKELKREPTLGANRLDFLVNGEVYIEVKTPVKNLQIDLPRELVVKHPQATGTSRMLSQVREISAELAKGEKKAIMLTVFMYDNPGFRVPRVHNEVYSETMLAMEQARAAGLRRWQLNLEFTPTHVRLARLFPLDTP